MATTKNIHGDTPATLAAKLGWKDMIDEVFSEYAVTYEYAETDLQIYKAALRNKWDDVCGLFEATPQLKIKPVNERLETPLMIAVGTNSSHDFVKQLLNNVHRYDSDQWCRVNIHGNNALHYAAKVGNMIDAKLMQQCLPYTMQRVKNIHGDTPYLLAAKLGSKDMLNILYTFTDNVGNLVVSAIQAGEIDFALGIIPRYTPDEKEPNALEALATKPEYFRSGNGLGFWCGLICPSCVLTRSFNSVLLLPFAYVKWQIQEIKRKKLPSQKIVLEICEKIEKNPKDAKKYFEPAIATAVKYGNVELIEECILAYPGLIWYEFDGYNLFHLAIKERQVQVYNLVYQMSGHKAFAASELHGEGKENALHIVASEHHGQEKENALHIVANEHHGEEKENALHIVAKLAPSHRLNTITGAALKLQNELQWYKEVETFVEPEHVKALNKDGKTPWMVFTHEHEALLKEGQQWMKDTATSCTVVAALIVTITFAAAITVPGGNEDDGKPVFLNERAFMLFMITDAIALFSSSTSLLMFLGILTSRYAEIDFLHALPKRLTIGLASLFLSIAGTMIAFGATLVLLLHDKVTWIAAPVVMMTSIPVGLYALLQFPLLVEIVWSTYGPSIFRKQGSRIIY
ncbi:ankyrin repeat-containing domain, PGG domain protein [Artemisia annua]|uniref:Ankyrin repeat-containing domain, PGG domain protein n=1 Tax=Artemisia annua TaxID=35608 RepID=A0A2U1NQ64_ARTAN|nr:ankyrin repeat-containing domain, PGG domain protein [Artemisia annua]